MYNFSLARKATRSQGIVNVNKRHEISIVLSVRIDNKRFNISFDHF